MLPVSKSFWAQAAPSSDAHPRAQTQTQTQTHTSMLSWPNKRCLICRASFKLRERAIYRVPTTMETQYPSHISKASSERKRGRGRERGGGRGGAHRKQATSFLPSSMSASPILFNVLASNSTCVLLVCFTTCRTSEKTEQLIRHSLIRHSWHEREPDSFSHVPPAPCIHDCLRSLLPPPPRSCRAARDLRDRGGRGVA